MLSMTHRNVRRRRRSQSVAGGSRTQRSTRKHAHACTHYTHAHTCAGIEPSKGTDRAKQQGHQSGGMYSLSLPSYCCPSCSAGSVRGTREREDETQLEHDREARKG